MQGEHHEIEAEFPEFHQRIKDLSANAPVFAESIKRHDELDKEIRKLEELGAACYRRHIRENEI